MLKARREALKISIAEVSISTKITSRMVQAIESGNMDSLPARTFLRGFVKSYASYLKMDHAAVMQSFTEDMALLEPAPAVPRSETDQEGHAGPAPQVNFTEDQSQRHVFVREGTSPLKKAGLGLGVFALVATIILVYQLVQKYEREGQVEAPPSTLSKIESKEGEAEAPIEIPAPSTEIKPEDENRPTVEAAAPAAEAVPVVEPKPVEEAKPIVETKPPVEVKPVPLPETKPVAEVKPPMPTPAPPPTPPPPVEAKPVPAPPKPASAVAAAKQEIIIEALDKVDISFKVNDGETRKVSLSPDQVHTIKASGIVAIEMSDGGAVNVIHNGRDVGVPGDLGRPKKIQFP